MNLAFYLSNQREAILEGYLQLARELPRERWLLVKPQALKDEADLPECIIDEPEWYGWRRNPLVLLRMVGMILRIRWIVRSKGLGTIFLYGIPSPWTFLLRILLIGTGIRWSLFVHDPKLHEGERLERRLITMLHEWLVMKPAKALVVSYSEGCLELLERRIGSPGAVHVLPLPMLSGMGKADAGMEASDLLFFGRLEAYKGIDLLGEVIELLADKGVRPKVLVVGRGPLAPEIDRICRKHGHVRRVGEFLPNAQLAGLVASSRMVVLPYRNATGTQIVQIANHHGIPVVATRVGCFTEYVVDGVNGVLVDPGDAEGFARSVEGILHGDRAAWERSCRKFAGERHSSPEFSRNIDKIVSGTVAE